MSLSSYYQKYDAKGAKECDLLFDYDEIRQSKMSQVQRLASFLEEKGLVEAAVHYVPLIHMNHKTW